MTTPVEEYLQEKQAQGFGSKVWQGVKDYAAPAIGGAAVSLGTMAAGKALMRGLDNAMLAITKKRDFNRMMENNPDLQEYQQEDPKRFNAQFTSLRNLNPSFSKDPIVAGTYMRQMSASPNNAGQAIVQSLGAARGLPQSPLAEATSAMQAPRVPLMGPKEEEMQDLQAQKLRGYSGEQAQKAEEFQHRQRMDEMRQRMAEEKELRDQEQHEAWRQRQQQGY